MNKRRFRLVGLASCLCNCIAPAFADGPLDPAFDSGYGPYAFPIGTGSAVAQSIALDATGRIITGGYSQSSPPRRDVLTVTRHSTAPAGVLDDKFMHGGIAASPFGDAQSRSTGVAVDHAGRIVTVGDVQLTLACGDSGTVNFYAVARFHGEDAPADAGKPDASFGGPWSGGTGVVVGDCAAAYQTSGLAVDTRDYITAVGNAFDQAHTRSVIGLVRWTSLGTTDNTFGSFGTVTTSYAGGDAYGKAIVLDSLNRAWVAADATTTSGSIGLVLRYTASGTLDTTFGVGGMASTSIGPGGSVCCIALDSEGRAIIAGDVNGLREDNHIFVARYTPSGSLDTTFGTDGFSKPPLSSSISISNSLAVDQRGRPIVAGYSADIRTGAATLVHFNLDGSLNTAVGFQGIYKTAFGLGSSIGTAVVLDSSNRPVVAIYGYDRDGNVPALIRYDEMFGDGFD